MGSFEYYYPQLYDSHQFNLLPLPITMYINMAIVD